MPSTSIPAASPPQDLAMVGDMDSSLAFAASPVPQALLDSSHRVVGANRAWITNLGGDPCGHLWSDLVHPADLADELPLIGRLQSERVGYRIATRLAMTGGKWLDAIIETTALENGALATILPVSQVAGHPASDPAASERRILAMALSHDLFQHARLAKVSMSLLARATLDATHRHRLCVACDHVGRLLEMMPRLAFWLRLADQPLAPVPCDLSLVVARIAPGLPGLELESHPLPVVNADPLLIRELFAAVLGNAACYTTSPVQITTQRDGDAWVIRIIDHGPGIPPAERARVLEPLHRLHTWDQAPGLGMGLAIASRIAERHGGRLWIDAGPDGGCIVCLNLPA